MPTITRRKAGENAAAKAEECQAKVFSPLSKLGPYSQSRSINEIHQLGTADNAIGEELLRLESLGEATANSVNR